MRSAMPSPCVYHVTARGVERRAVFLDDIDRVIFVVLLRAATRRWGWRMIVYCLLTNHFHFVLFADVSDLSTGMQWLMGRYAQLFNERYDRTGHLFQGRFHARAVEDDEYLAHVCDYVLDNPIRAGLCQDRADWPWLGGAVAA
jgi:REP element-mobilizing transposase RayT